jgi:hypothetical protein
MRQVKPNNSCRIEVRNPQKSIGWQPVLKFDEKLYPKYERLTDSLNHMNAPFQVRIARGTD